MKRTIRNICLLAAIMVGTQCSSARADDLFVLIWRGTLSVTDSAGNISTRPFTERNVVNVIARNNGLNPNALVLVYRPDKFDTAVVYRSDGQVVSDHVQIPDITRVGSNWITDAGTGRRVVRQAFIFDEYHDSPIGSIFGVQALARNQDGSVRNMVFYGRFNLAYQDVTDGFPAGVYAGSFSTGARIRDRSNSQ
jgi:hypothetical protein